MTASRRSEPQVLPPDADLVALAAQVNAALPDGLSVSFFCGERETGIIYQAGPRRATIRRQGPVYANEANDIIAAIKDWADEAESRERGLRTWTTNSIEDV